MVKHIANFDNISSYEVILEFSNKMAPSTLCDDSSPYVSIKTEIDANALIEEAKQFCEKYGQEFTSQMVEENKSEKFVPGKYDL